MSDETTRLYVSTENDVGRLIKRVEALEEEIAALNARCTKIVDHICDKTHPYIREVNGMCGEVSQRLRHIEFHLFPHLAKDLTDLHKIIPQTDEILNDDLDIRLPPSGKDGEKKLK